MRKNYPKNRKTSEERYTTQYVYIKDRPFIKRIVHHPMKTIFINACAWPWATEDEVIRY